MNILRLKSCESASDAAPITAKKIREKNNRDGIVAYMSGDRRFFGCVYHINSSVGARDFQQNLQCAAHSSGNALLT